MRAVAAAAEVDAALVHHYFGTKQQLFAAATHMPIDPMTILGPMRETPTEDLGLALPSMLLQLWDSDMGQRLVATGRSLLAGPHVGLLRAFFEDLLTKELGSRINYPLGTGKIRAQFVASQLMGVVMARYIVKIEPFASLPAQQIAQTIAPNLQRYLTGDLPDGHVP